MEMNLNLFSSFFAGIISTLTPCVYPLIPITLSIIKADKKSKRSLAFARALLYSLGIFLSYTSLGIIAVLSGGFFGELWTSASLRIGLGALLILLSFYSLEIFKFKSDGLLSKLGSKLSSNDKYGAIAAGAISGVLAAPCTGPLLAAILTFAASSSEKTQGILLLISYSAGFSLPFLVLATFPNLLRVIPKSGQWLHAIKFIIAAGLFAFGLSYILTALIDPRINRIKWNSFELKVFSLIIFAVSVYFSGKSIRLEHRFRSLVLLILASFSLLAPLSLIKSKVIRSDISELKALTDKPKIVFFTAEWCTNCHEIKETLLVHQQVAQQLQQFEILEVDLTELSNSERAIQKDFSVRGLPTLIFTCPNFKEILGSRITSLLTQEEFGEILIKNLTSAANCSL